MAAHGFRALLLLGLFYAFPAQAWQLFTTESAKPAIAASSLPAEARSTLQLIKQGGPFPSPRDGVVFGNYEHVLPKQPRGYYHEYTVKTPGAHNRGARRIVCGVAPARGGPMGSPPLRSDPFALPECYYTGDHYQTFQRIEEGK